MNHAVAQLIVVRIEFLRQPFSRHPQRKAHMLVQRLHITQFNSTSLTKHLFLHLQALASDMHMPLNPFNRASLSLFLSETGFHFEQYADVGIVQLLELEGHPMFRAMESLMKDCIPFMSRASDVQHDGIAVSFCTQPSESQ